jgi:hypothetical protein
MSGTRVRAGLSTITANMGNNNYLPPEGYKVGKVYAVILSDKSVPQSVWEANGEWDGIGTILYQEYDEDGELAIADITDNTLATLPTALPLYPNQKYFPLLGEIVLLMNLPSAPSPITNKTEETYYISTVNAWNSPQFNGLFLDEAKNILYDSFTENENFRGLQTFEGDYILEGRFGNSIRFGSTNKSGNIDNSPWSTNPGEISNNPIVLITNQHNFKLPGSDLYVENINVDGASIYLTSEQKIPLNIGNVKLTNLVQPFTISPQDYTQPQVIINANRTVISSKTDEVLVFGKSGVQMYSQGPIYLQSNKVGLYMDGKKIFLGPTSPIAGQPLVLGNNLKIVLSNLIKAMSNFCSLTSGAINNPEGIAEMGFNAGVSAFQLSLRALNRDINKTNYLLSKITYTV